MHARLTQQTDIAVSFCDPHSPWQKGRNQNTNGPVRQYLPRTPICRCDSQEQLDAIADEVNDRPRQGMGRTIFMGRLPRVVAQ